MNNIPEQSSDSLIRDAYVNYGQYVNSYRSLPAVDGLKPVQRRVLFSLKNVAWNNFVKSARVVGETLGKYHPHGETSVYGAMVKMVRRGLITGQGNFGARMMTSLEAAKMRYTEVKMKPSLKDFFFKLIDSVPMYENSINEMEYKYLPVPIPVALFTGSRGVGVGCTTRIPAFTFASILEAFAKDDPTKLKAQYGYYILNADYKDLWEKGHGEILYKFNVATTFNKHDNRNVVSIEGSGELFRPRMKAVLKPYLEEELVYLRDESVKRIRLIVSRAPHVKKITDDELLDMCHIAASKSIPYIIRASIDGVATKLGLRDWLNLTYGRFITDFEKHKNSRLSKIESKLKDIKYIKEVSELLQEGISLTSIAKKLKIEKGIISRIEEKPIRLLRDSEIKKATALLKKQYSEIKKEEPNAYLRALVSEIY